MRAKLAPVLIVAAFVALLPPQSESVLRRGPRLGLSKPSGRQAAYRPVKPLPPRPIERGMARRGWRAGGHVPPPGPRQARHSEAITSSSLSARGASWALAATTAREKSIPDVCLTPPPQWASGAALPWPQHGGADNAASGRRRLLVGGSNKWRPQTFQEPAESSVEARHAVEQLQQGLGRRGRRAAPTGWNRIFSPAATRHSLGSCAVVGLSRRLVGSCLGRAIDAHDTVFRFGGAPVKGWEVDVGTRKSIQLVRRPSGSKCKDIDHDVWFKGSNTGFSSASAADTRRPESFYLMLGESADKCPERERISSFKGTPVRCQCYLSHPLYISFFHKIGSNIYTGLAAGYNP